MATQVYGVPSVGNRYISHVKVRSPSGYGSTGTFTRCYTTLEINNGGGDILYVKDTVLGDYFLIKTPGVYACVASDYASAGPCELGFTKDAEKLGPTLVSSTCHDFSAPIYSQYLYSLSTGATATFTSTHAIIPCQAGATIRLQTNGNANYTGENSFCYIAKIA